MHRVLGYWNQHDKPIPMVCVNRVFARSCKLQGTTAIDLIATELSDRLVIVYTVSGGALIAPMKPWNALPLERQMELERPTKYLKHHAV